MRGILVVASALTAVLTSGAPIADGHAASTRRAAVRLENGVLINSRAKYHFAMPQGWVLDGTSDWSSPDLTHTQISWQAGQPGVRDGSEGRAAPVQS
jgi:hypothetical protein